MKDNPLVSVVIPTYNRPIYLERCIKSVLKQSYKNIEIIVVDDNNPDTPARFETEKIMKKYLSNYRVRYLKHCCNKNGSAARNTGWRNSNGKYITFIDDDDIILPLKIEKQVQCMESLNEKWGACYTGYKIKKPNGSIQISNEKRQGKRYVDALMRTLFMGSGSNLFIRKKIVDEINGYDESFNRNQDIEFLARILEKYKIAFVDDYLLLIYQDSDRTESKTFEQLESYTLHYLKVFQNRINKLNPKEKENVISVISLERCRIAFYKKKYKTGINILIENRVRVAVVFRYIKYLIDRKISNQSYGFNCR